MYLNKYIKITIISIFVLIFQESALAWEHEIAIGYGSGTELQEYYKNSGYELSGIFYKFPKIDQNLIATINGTIGQWRADTDEFRNLTTAALSLGLRGYAVNPDTHTLRPYAGISFGPTYLSSEQFGSQVQNTHIAFQSQLGVGAEIGNSQRSIDFNFHMDHFCNAGLASPNQGYNILYIFSIGYQF